MTRSPRKAMLLIAAALLATAAVAAPASPAAAHTPSVSATCTTLSVSLQSYVSTQSNPRPNRVTVTVDGSTLVAEDFGGSFRRDVALGDSARPHTWRVVVDAVDNGYDRSFEGTSTPCAPVDVRDAAARVQTTAPTCTAAATLVLGTPVNARWSTPSATTGPAVFTVTATADRGHLFDDGKATRVFTGTLAGPLQAGAAECAPATVPPAAAPPSSPPPTATPPRATTPRAVPKPAPLAMSSQAVTMSCDDRMVVTTTTRTVTDWVQAAGAWVEGTPVVTTSRSTERLNPGDCPGAIAGGGLGSGSGLGGAGAPVLAAAAGGGTGLAGAILDALAHAGADVAVAICLAISLLAAGGIILLRRRQEAGGLAD